ncbi:hypothetical protein DT076_13245 [Desertihabitans brevis]|uniref:Uncharacterized protein n=1 Tax=Desertihabitans brevis TaxID=2268447 RepID=A0A367YSL7_9ACTN|nr:hypothetical protein [Desertihabitans brevis]RCK68885.1 hypothetical protein DT076_13245 [Desertihabitans brevis]
MSAPTDRVPVRPTRRSVDVGVLILGLIMLPVAALVVWTSLGLAVDWGTLAVLAPVGLVLVGGLGLVLSRQ